MFSKLKGNYKFFSPKFKQKVQSYFGSLFQSSLFMVYYSFVKTLNHIIFGVIHELKNASRIFSEIGASVLHKEPQTQSNRFCLVYEGIGTVFCAPP